ARFARLLRQANDAEVADVRMVGEHDYEISPHKADLALQMRTASGPAGDATPAAPESGVVTPRAPAALRFRGGSRSAARPPLQMVGVIALDTPAEPAPVPAAPVDEAVPAAAPKERTKRGARKKADAAAPAPAEAKAPKETKAAKGRGGK